VSGSEGWLTTVDQALSASSNFVVLILAARVLDTAEFGRFALASSVYVLYVSYSRAVVGEPLLILGRPCREDHLRVLNERVARQAVTLTLIGAIALMARTPALLDLLGVVLVFSGVLLLHDLLRYRAIARGEPSAAIRIDLLWLVLVLAGYLSFGHTLSSTAWQLLVLWAVSGGIAAAVGVALDPRSLPRRVPVRRPATTHDQHLLPGLRGEFVARTATLHAGLGAISVVAGPSALGVFRLADAVMGPLRTLITGLTLAFIPWTVVHRHQTRAVRRRFRRSAGLIFAVAAPLPVALLLLDAEWLTTILGSTWMDARTIVLPIWVFSVMTGLAALAGAGLKALQDTRLIFVLRLVTGTLLAVALPGGAMLGAAPGAAQAAAGVGVATFVVWWWAFEAALTAQDRAR
jgi:O-antigen/teichoic acid export membrane protein